MISISKNMDLRHPRENITSLNKNSRTHGPSKPPLIKTIVSFASPNSMKQSALES